MKARIEAILARITSRTGRQDPSEVLAILTSSRGDEIDRLLAGLDLDALLNEGNLVIGSPTQALLQRLTVERLADLTVPTRATLIRALQRGLPGALSERAIRTIFLGTTGRALTDLKVAIDSGADHSDLHQLVFHDIDNAILREEILMHLDQEGRANPIDEVKVLSDIDDTFFASWKDVRFPLKTVYPGVLQLYAELDRGAGDVPKMAGDLTFVTARPGDGLGVIEKSLHKALQEHGAPLSTILTGSFAHLLGKRAIAAKKLDNFERYRRLYPEYGFVFVGDSGQGDILFGEQMLALGAVKAVFIHDVENTPEPTRSSLQQRGILLFDTYVGAAVHAYPRCLIQRSGMARVAAAAVAKFDAIPWRSLSQKQARAAELAHDIERVNAYLPQEERLSF